MTKLLVKPTGEFHCSGACGILVGDRIVLTGGLGGGDYMKNVDKYTTSDWVKALPPLQHGRAWHGCGVIEQVSF